MPRQSRARTAAMATERAMRARVAGAPGMGKPVSASKAVASSQRRRSRTKPAPPPATATAGSRISFRMKTTLSG